MNGIDFEEIKVDLSKRQHLSPEFQGNQSIFDFCFRGKQYLYTLSSLILLDFPSAINPLRKVPAIVDGRFKLFERYFSFKISCLMRFFKFHCVIGLVLVTVIKTFRAYGVCNYLLFC